MSPPKGEVSRWTLYRMKPRWRTAPNGRSGSLVGGEWTSERAVHDEIVESVEVMPVAEHENAVAVKRQAFEVAEGGRKLWMARALIYGDALQRITDADPPALDALRIASKALGDATEYENTGRVAFESPLPRLDLPQSPTSKARP